MADEKSSESDQQKPQSQLVEHAGEIAGLSAWLKAIPTIRKEWQGLKDGKILFVSLAIIAGILVSSYVIAPLKTEISNLNAELAPYKAVDRLTKRLFPNASPDVRMAEVLEILKKQEQDELNKSTQPSLRIKEVGLARLKNRSLYECVFENVADFPIRNLFIGTWVSDTNLNTLFLHENYVPSEPVLQHATVRFRSLLPTNFAHPWPSFYVFHEAHYKFPSGIIKTQVFLSEPDIGELWTAADAELGMRSVRDRERIEAQFLKKVREAK